MDNLDQATIKAKFIEFLDTIEDEKLRHAMQVQLKRNTHLVTGAMLFDESGRLCLIQETKPFYAGKWNLPLGHVEKGETIVAAARREVKEETGYDVELTALLPPQSFSGGHLFRILYLGKIIGGSPDDRDAHGISAVAWFTISEIKQKFQSGELRDDGIIHDLELYQTGITLPLDTIKEVQYSQSEDC